MKKYMFLLTMIVSFFLVGCENLDDSKDLIIKFNTETLQVSYINRAYDVKITNENVRFRFILTPTANEEPFKQIVVNGMTIKEFTQNEGLIEFSILNEHPSNPDALVDVFVSMDPNGGYWQKDYVSEIEPLSKMTITTKNDNSSETFSLFDRSMTGLRFYYKLFIQYNDELNLYEVIKKDAATNTVAMIAPIEYDFVLGVATNFGDDQIKNKIMDFVATEDRLFVDFDIDPTTYMSGELNVLFYNDELLSNEIMMTLKETQILPEPKRSGYTFVGWSDGINTYKDFKGYQAKELTYELDLVAVWQEKTIEELEVYLDSLIPVIVEDNLLFDTKYSAFTLNFTSSNPAVLSNEGRYQRPYQQTNVRIEVSVSVGDEHIKTIRYNVIAKGYKTLDYGVASSYIYRNYSKVDDLFFDTLDVINTAFITADGNGNLSGSSYLTNVKTYIMPKAKENGNWVIMSIAPESSWSTIASSQSSMDNLANQIVDFINLHGFDGVDIDWETPTDSEKTRFTQLMKTVYQKVKSNNANHLVTTAITGGMWQPPRYDLLNSKPYIDYINLMTYGMTSSNGQYQNPLYRSTTFHNQTFKAGASLNTASIDESVKMLKNNYGIDYKKIIVGVAFYGIKQTRTFNESTNTFDNFKNAGSVYYNYIEQIYMTDSNYSVVYDQNAGVPYIIKNDGTEFISYDNRQSILEKGNYILKNQLGGMMFWEYGTDSTNILLEAVKDGLGK